MYFLLQDDIGSRLGPDQIHVLKLYLLELKLYLFGTLSMTNNKITFLFSIPVECPSHASGAFVPSI
jgi:hypothetical protein